MSISIKKQTDDVFVVAVLIATMKLSAFNLEIASELGLFALMASALSSSMALVLLNRFLKPAIG